MVMHSPGLEQQKMFVGILEQQYGYWRGRETITPFNSVTRSDCVKAFVTVRLGADEDGAYPREEVLNHLLDLDGGSETARAAATVWELEGADGILAFIWALDDADQEAERLAAEAEAARDIELYEAETAASIAAGEVRVRAR